VRRVGLLLLCAVLLAAPGTPAQAGTVLVCAVDSPIASLSREQAEQLYLGRSRELPGGIAVTLVDLPPGPVRDDFYMQLTGKNPAQIRAYWSRMVFTGRALPPREARDVEEALDWLAANPRLIAYLPESAAGPEVRTLLRLP